MIIQILTLYTPPILLIRLTLLLIIKIAIPVRIKIKQLSPRLQNTTPLPISPLWLLQIPGQIPADYHIKHIILKLQILRIHLIKSNIPAKFPCILLRSIQHLLRIIHRSNPIPRSSQNNRKKARSGTNIQNLQLLLRFLRKLTLKNLKPRPLLHPIQFLMIHLRIPLRAGSPIALNLRQ